LDRQGHATVLWPGGPGATHSWSLSPNGRWIAWITGASFTVCQVDGPPRRIGLAAPLVGMGGPAPPVVEAIGFWDLRTGTGWLRTADQLGFVPHSWRDEALLWRPDSAHLLVAGWSRPPEPTAARLNLYELGRDAAVPVRQLLTTPEDMLYLQRLLPDGTLYYYTGGEGSTHGQIWRRTPTGTSTPIGEDCTCRITYTARQLEITRYAYPPQPGVRYDLATGRPLPADLPGTGAGPARGLPPVPWPNTGRPAADGGGLLGLLGAGLVLLGLVIRRRPA
ncbi:MAG TPA: hypothetical protein VKY74_22560, partial [Chloroflexia bacterium]|nr:hypothetical protein [Chloroflexia bacterium]